MENDSLSYAILLSPSNIESNSWILSSNFRAELRTIQNSRPFPSRIQDVCGSQMHCIPLHQGVQIKYVYSKKNPGGPKTGVQ